MDLAQEWLASGAAETVRDLRGFAAAVSRECRALLAAGLLVGGGIEAAATDQARRAVDMLVARRVCVAVGREGVRLADGAAVALARLRRMLGVLSAACW